MSYSAALTVLTVASRYGPPELAPCHVRSSHVQQIGCAARPLGALRHEIADARRNRIGLDHILDGDAPVCPVSVRETASHGEGGFAGSRPHGEVGHSRQLFQPDVGNDAQPMRYRAQQRTEDLRSRRLERAPYLRLW